MSEITELEVTATYADGSQRRVTMTGAINADSIMRAYHSLAFDFDRMMAKTRAEWAEHFPGVPFPDAGQA